MIPIFKSKLNESSAHRLHETITITKKDTGHTTKDKK